MRHVHKWTSERNQNKWTIKRMSGINTCSSSGAWSNPCDREWLVWPWCSLVKREQSMEMCIRDLDNKWTGGVWTAMWRLVQQQPMQINWHCDWSFYIKYAGFLSLCCLVFIFSWKWIISFQQSFLLFCIFDVSRCSLMTNCKLYLVVLDFLPLMKSPLIHHCL